MALCAAASCSAPADPVGPPPQRTDVIATDPCTESVASTAGLSAGLWDRPFAERRITELLDEHSIPYEVGSGEWHVLVQPRLAAKARDLLGAAIEAENLAARVEPADPAGRRPYELPPAAIARWPASVRPGSERFRNELCERLRKEQIPHFVIGFGGEWTVYVRADKAEPGRAIATEMIAAAGVPAVVVPR
jgi:hypothetical protein